MHVEKNLKQTIYNLLSKQNDFYVLSRVYLINSLTNDKSKNTIVAMRNKQFLRILGEVAMELGCNYVIYKYHARKGYRDGKFYFFKSLDHPLAKALIESKNVKVYSIDNLLC